MSLADTLVKLAEKAGELLSGNVIPLAVEIGKDVVNLIQKAVPIVAETDVAKLQAAQADLEVKVLAHADSTIAELKGE